MKAMLVGLALAASAASPAIAMGERPASVETITYERGPCHGTCPVYRVTVSSNGRGTFEGIQHTAATGTRSFRATTAQWAEFKRRLAADRPVGEVMLDGPERCAMYATDLPTIDVRWSGARRPGHLAYNIGCDRPTHARMARALTSAPEALPIARFIGAN